MSESLIIPKRAARRLYALLALPAALAILLAAGLPPSSENPD